MDLIEKSIINDITLITIGKELIDPAYYYFQQLITEIEQTPTVPRDLNPVGQLSISTCDNYTVYRLHMTVWLYSITGSYPFRCFISIDEYGIWGSYLPNCCTSSLYCATRALRPSSLSML